MSTVHTLAQTGFNQANDLYDRARPSYQSKALSYIREVVKSKSPVNIVELGAGTGIFTRALLAHPKWTSQVQQIKAIEPSPGMREVFSQTVQDQRVTIEDGTFDTTGVEDNWADLIVIAQAFHWCPDYDRASAEFARILKPDGVVVLIWNLEDRDRARWVAEIRNRIEKYESGSPQFRLGLWRQTFDTKSYQQFFQPPVEKVWPYELPTTVDRAVDRASSKSYIVVLPEDEKAEVQKDIRAVAEKGEDRIWVDEANAPPHPHLESQMAPKPASTAGKAPASTASKAPAKTEGAKKTASKSKAAAPADGEKKKRRKVRKETYSSYIYKVLKQVHPDTGISNKAMAILNSFVNDIFERIATEASKLASYSKKSTISSREIQTSVRLILPGELAKHAISEGTKSVTKFSAGGK
ncbi:hypothetical protein DXG03_006657 [Asterophora parasitica]|uniref:Histone H2B n=2 Tax=Lyophyllaceae TaxID=930979 RepID=A0A9P7KDV1_9AGAR|nr:hypothetical protein DXG03_006657 [Asterophora parasitica]